VGSENVACVASMIGRGSPSLYSKRRATETAPESFARSPLLTLFHCEQTAGPPRDTATRAVPPSRRNCASVWTHRYVSSQSFLFLYLYYPRTPTDVSVLCTEIARKEEEHRQLPPDENVSQGRGSAQEGRCSGLNCFGFQRGLALAYQARPVIEIFIGSYWITHTLQESEPVPASCQCQCRI
jgi:hypothetical protein